ncbi:cupin domain-containing protein [Marinibacterium sp. SX1]|uniref:cupin domain-containing protein n=1 Tax=Marinibacterium sp. SX1 TaxID=3388424 RepID=UPI003D174F54
MPKLDPDALKAAAHRDADELGAFERITLGDPGGLTQFGVAIETLMPGARSSNRHWHLREDEFLLMLDGAAVLVEETGESAIGPGDAVCWPAGAANGHMVVNRSDAPCRFLIVGTRATDDICTYPDLGQTLYNEGPNWRLVDDATGAIIRQGTR